MAPMVIMTVLTQPDRLKHHARRTITADLIVRSANCSLLLSPLGAITPWCCRSWLPWLIRVLVVGHGTGWDDPRDGGVCGTAGARSFDAIAEWAGDADDQTREEVGIVDAMPCESTIRRTLQRLDADAIDDRIRPGRRSAPCRQRNERRLIAVDGKTKRGSRESSGSGSTSRPASRC
jgi:hypothetical protein